MVQQWWQKLNANERMAATGAIIVFIASLLGSGWLSLIGSGVVLAVYWLKYSPNQISWPAPVQLITLVISAIIGLFALLGLIGVLGIGSLGFGFGFGGLFGGFYALIVIGAIVAAVGAGMMVLGTWREYQAMPKAPAPPAGGPPPPPPAPPAQPPAAPPSEPPTA
jgi:hypothetical protein